MSLTKSLYATLATLLVAENALALTTKTSGETFGVTKSAELQLGAGTSAWDTIANIIKQLLTLVSIIAVGYVLYAGFQIMTAGGDEEKVKTGRKTIIYVIIGIIVMWLAFWIVNLVLQSLT